MNAHQRLETAGEAGVRLVVERDHAEIILHTPGEKVNKLTRAAFQELFDHILFLKNKGDQIKTLLVWSDKPDMFLAGADINEIQGMTDRAQALELVHRAQEVFQELSELPQVTMVAIDGPCLGGGCELALACQYRLASDSRSTSIALPEVKLGVLPGAGGTQRLPRIVGLVNALKMMTQGSGFDGRRALKMGLVDDVVPKERLLDTARKVLKEKLYSRYQKKETVAQWFVESTPLKKMIFSQARKQVIALSQGNYPAPLKIIDVVEQTFYKPLKEGLKIEAEGFAELALSPVAKNLLNLFFASEELKKDRGVAASEAQGFKPESLQRIGVLGAGIMGGGIAAVATGKGIGVRLKDVSHASIQTGLKTARSLFDKDLKRKKIDRSEMRKRMYRISPTLTMAGFHDLPFVIEAVVEKMEIKKSVIAELDRILPPHAIIASNTSSLSISEMAVASSRPEQVVGMHFFNPVPKMPLVEVIRADKTKPEVVAQTVALGRQMGKTVIVVKDRPGFLVNRVLMPFLIECAHLHQDGYSVAQIDKAATSFGMPMGPFRLLDEIGLDTAAKVAQVIATAFPHLKVLPMIESLVQNGQFGKKSGRGFYLYDERGKSVGLTQEFQRSPRDPSPQTEVLIQDRLILPMVTEAVMALDEGTVTTVRDVDMGLIFGIGFPPFRGGLLKWVSDVGERQILDRMNVLHNTTQGRLIVPDGLKSRVQAGQSFYSRRT
jgi:3-hydroxyacyl-CoA dehydrogenase/enoyl-CoA hydratase/3-hydroxybutyryl-CoA epimerase